MIINLSPQVSNKTLSLSVNSDILTLNGEDLDFSVIPDGATLPASAIDCEYIIGDVERIDGVLHITVLLPLGADASEAARFPEPIIDPEDGPLELPQ